MPELYEIRVEAQLKESRWSYWFAGLTTREEPNGQTVLYGPVHDQSALHGILAKIRDLNLTLISVIRIDREQLQE